MACRDRPIRRPDASASTLATATDCRRENEPSAPHTGPILQGHQDPARNRSASRSSNPQCQMACTSPRFVVPARTKVVDRHSLLWRTAGRAFRRCQMARRCLKSLSLQPEKQRQKPKQKGRNWPELLDQLRSDCHLQTPEMSPFESPLCCLRRWIVTNFDRQISSRATAVCNEEFRDLCQRAVI